MSLLEIADLKVNYGQIEALKGVSLRVETREIVAILGANGAGKTTLMRTISGLLTPRGGSIVFEGTDITRLGADRIVRLGIAQSPEGRRVFGTLSVMENLRLGAFTRPAGEVAGSLDFVLQMFPRLAERRSQLAGTMSGGEQQMLAIGRALMAKPRLLLLDEPSLGLAPIIVQGIFRTLREIANSGVTILIVEQNARSALKLADRGYVLEVGRFVIEDNAKTLLTSPEVQAAYLGGERRKA
ncbi:ABC transporter ATP-binding protein [Acidiphilium multivorum]|uniref:Branched-chain amino acid ABC transporter ATP-binding protein n=1 Tax=Acidiphilium multivorum (strain DSM 11245 / JCM 8867 / NBRC 100883 / AIU 301) TaxID=926570 RepID=F0J2U5_ACIMA|nr:MULTISPECIES: ABC transporter ATP-binding protein [Acidiphilium]MBS3025202.1 ABC transporter ATP-binding protein [Acidiphilium multivorum]BAJ79734.1 branched-chain amino acid ABC transporter ATP-binding protein [Acidiphilium multivorum AIU301]GAN75062.1 ABC transporter branched-chain amino acid permease [Acidiphilium multivorum AIU301]